MFFFSFSESDTWREGVTVAEVVGECVGASLDGDAGFGKW